MCRPVACDACGRTTWAGCGQHVEQVMAHVPVSERCSCTPEDRARAAADRPSLFRRLLRR